MGPPPLPSKASTVSSSPGRSEKFPTPGFARLLRGKGGSRSRSRTSLTHSSPLFPSRSRKLSREVPSMDSGDQGEPSSPKVTCIGQVRIRKKHRTSTRSDFKGNRTHLKQKKRTKREMRCCFINKSLLRSVFRCRQSIWKRWSVKLSLKGNAGFRRVNEKVEPAEAVPLPLGTDLTEIGSRFGFQKAEREDKVEAEYGELKARVFVPPKNALMLMRCRSAPHNRSSVLASRFSAMGNDVDSGKGDDEIGKTTGSNESPNEAEEEETRCPSPRPLYLMRCNSEPAKKAARLVEQEAARCSQNGDEASRRSVKSPSQLD